MSDSPASQRVPTAKLRSEADVPKNASRIQAKETSEYSQLHVFLQDSVNKDLVEQSNRLTDTAKSLLTLQLAIPSLFAVMLKLLSGDKATLVQTDHIANVLIVGAFLCWMLSLGFTLSILRPDSYRVNLLVTSRKVDGENDKEQTLGLMEFYEQSAKRKFNRITISSILTFLGVLLMVFHLLNF